jgi:hypothetical protein
LETAFIFFRGLLWSGAQPSFWVRSEEFLQGKKGVNWYSI